MNPNGFGPSARPLGGQDPHMRPDVETGLIAGTAVLTRDGILPVEFLSPGDGIITRDSGMARLEHIGRLPIITRAISIAAGSFGETDHQADLIVPAGQMVLVRDWRAQTMFGTNIAMVRADALIDGEYVIDLGPQKMRLHQLGFAAPHIVYAGGIELACGTDAAALLDFAA